jgi:hypothetical protein
VKVSFATKLVCDIKMLIKAKNRVSNKVCRPQFQEKYNFVKEI